MSRALTCEDVRSLAPEVALGIASGEERARVLAHVRGCAECGRLLEDLAGTADALLLLAPGQEPSSGFESTVLGRMALPRSSSVRRMAPALAAACLAALLGAGATMWLTAGDRGLGARYRATLEEADGEYFGVVTVREPDGSANGHLFVYEGSPSWVFFVFDHPPTGDDYTVRILAEDGHRIELDAPALDEERLAWGLDVPLSIRSVKAVQILDSQGSVVLIAAFPER